MELENFIDIFRSLIRMSIPILFAALGENISEKSGVLNIGVEGMMLMGAFTGYAGSHLLDSPWGGLLLAIISGGLLALVFSYFCITLKTNQIVVGLGLNMISAGLTGFLYRHFFSNVMNPVYFVKDFKNISLPFLSKLPVLGELFFNYNILVYLAIVFVLLFWYLFKKTSLGIIITSIGEHPEAVDSLGIDVIKYKYLSVITCGVLAAIGGCFLSIAHSNSFVEGMSAGKGYIALAIIILGKWKPGGVFAGALLFGAASAIQLIIQTTGSSIPYDLVLMIPYIMTVIAVIIASKSKVGAPSGLAVPYIKE
ncbi:MAG: ABC transporter permease [Halanaerobiales bacterium]|nr:ABC transporter permease [Halanaerobiales bacterium]